MGPHGGVCGGDAKDHQWENTEKHAKEADSGIHNLVNAVRAFWRKV